MRAPISVIIPTLDAVHLLGPTLGAVMEGVDAGIVRELVISDGGSKDEIAVLADDLGATFVQGGAGRGGQLARGANVAQGEWLLFLHADTLLETGWSADVVQRLGDPARATAFSLAFHSDAGMARMTAGWANLRSRVLKLPYGDQGLLVSRALYDEVGGYRDIALMEDVAMSRALRGRIDLSAVRARTSATRYQTNGWLRQGGRNLIRLGRFLCGTDPNRLARDYGDR